MVSGMLSDLFEGDSTHDPTRVDVLPMSHHRLTREATARKVHNAETTTIDTSAQMQFNPRPSNQAGAVIAKIENIFSSIADSILNERNGLVIPLKSRTRVGNFPKTETTEGSTKTGVRNISFPNKNTKEAWKFTVLFRILELSHEALVTGIVTTKRDIYYRDPALFMRQEIVDRYVDDIAYTFGVDRHALNVVAAAKGLACGKLIITRKDQSVLELTEPEGTLVPNPYIIEKVRLDDICWILVIEKEATFRTLATSRYWDASIAGSGILITAKGYPDIQTRRFLHLLTITRPDIPVFALVDYDPDGLGIMSTYKYGSISLAHEKDVAVPSIRWLGVRSSDFLKTETDVPGFLTLTKRDRRVAGIMLDRHDEGGKDEEWRRELQIMLMLNIKAEIQNLGNGATLGDWLDKKLVGAI